MVKTLVRDACLRHWGAAEAKKGLIDICYLDFLVVRV